MTWSNAKRILIADDHDIVRLGIRTLIETRDSWSVVAEAADGATALEMALELKPDICVLDYSLPSMNGIDLTREILRSLPKTRILIFTMHDVEDIVHDVLVAGAKGFLLKSDTDEHLVAAIESLAANKPYFTDSVSETLLAKYLNRVSGSLATVLTSREREVVQLIAEGHSNKEVGRVLKISPKTVECHRASAMQKLHINSAAGLVRYAVRNRIVEA